MRRCLRFLSFAMAVVLMYVGATTVAGCGSPVASAEHLGTWSGKNTVVAVKITVAGKPDDYTAKLATAGGAFYGNWHSGKADADGNVVFDTVTLGFEGSQLTNHLDLTLGPVIGDTMTVTFNTPEIPTQEVEVKRQ